MKKNEVIATLSVFFVLVAITSQVITWLSKISPWCSFVAICLFSVIAIVCYCINERRGEDYE